MIPDLQRDPVLPRPPQHLVLGAVGQRQDQVDIGRQAADVDVEPGQCLDESVAPPR